jgi:hypothetical protein
VTGSRVPVTTALEVGTAIGLSVVVLFWLYWPTGRKP